MANEQPFTQGINTISSPSTTRPTAQECADVKAWASRIEEAREFDKVARKRYALDRRYARADHTHFEVDVPIAQSYIDVLKSFLYARDPDVDVIPSGLTEPPPQKDITAMVAAQLEAGVTPSAPSAGLPQAIAQLLGRGSLSAQGAPTLPGSAPQTNAPNAPQLNTPPTMTGDDPDSRIQQMAAQIMKPYQQLRDDAKQLSATLELVIHSLWKKARLKDRALPLVGSSLTVGIGWLKGCWLERMGKDPVVQQQIDDIHEKLALMANTRRELDEGEGDEDALKAQLQQQMEGLEAKVDVLLARGFAIDFVAAEDIQVSTDVPTLSQYLDAGWIAHRAFLPLKQAQADYPDIADKLKSATPFFPVRPSDANQVRDSGAIATDVQASDADAYRRGGDASGAEQKGECFVCIWEIWSRDESMIITFAEGTDVYAVPPHAPDPGTTRFYPFFQFAIGTVDGERHPRSCITRSERLFDEYNRARSAYAKHRRRAIPKTGFDATNYSKEEVAKLEAAETGEMVGLKPIRPGEPIANALAPIKYNQVDMGLYDTSVIRSELEMIWGVQEALSSSIHTAKTLGEAEIQQQGTQSRIGYMRDGLDSMLSELAQYTAEIALQKMKDDDVKAISGPWSLWPEGMTIEDISALVTVSIHAGSTGKPDTTAQRQAWSTIMPLLQSAIKDVGQLRGSSPDEIADCVEALIVETVNRTGDRVDATQFLPDPPRTPPPPPQPPAPPPIELSAYSGPQIQSMTAVLADVRGGVITPSAAVALISAVAPVIPQQLVQAMVDGSAPQPADGPTQLAAPHAKTIDVAPDPMIPPHSPEVSPPLNTAPLPPLPPMNPNPMNPGDQPHVN